MAFTFTDDNFQVEALDTEKLVMVDFWAEWCGPCRRVAPIIDEIAEEYGDKVVVGKLDVDSQPNVSTQFKVRSIPTVLLLKDGKVVEKLVGAKPKGAYLAAIEKHS